MAILLNKEEFEPSDLLIKPQEILLRFQKTFGNDNIPTAIQRPYRNSLIYLGNFLVFLLSWILLFHLSARSEWAMANTSHFWSVALLLLVLVSAAWFRVAHRLTALFRLQVVIASNLALTDPDMGQLLQIPNDRRDQIVKRIEKLLQDARDSAACRQSVNLSVVSFGGVELRR